MEKHALERMMERGISRDQVRNALLQGVIIESHPDDYSIPSFLLAGFQPSALHVVIAYDLVSTTVPYGYRLSPQPDPF